MVNNFSRGAYVISNDGTNTMVAHTVDVYQTSPVWTYSDAITGVYNIIESVKGIPGAVYIFGQSVIEGADALSWDVTPGGGTHSVPGLGGTVIDRNGSISLTIEATNTGGAAGASYVIDVYNVGFSCSIPIVNVISGSATNASWEPCGVTSGAGWQSGLGYPCVDRFRLFNLNTNPTPFTAVITFDNSDPTCNGSTMTGIFKSRYSTDYGASWGSEEIVDTVAGTPGFSVGPRGVAALAGGDQRVRTALAGGAYATTTNGGAVGSYPISVCVPTYKIGSTSLTNPPAAPEFIFASPAVVASHALWKVVLSGKIGISPLVSATPATGVSPFGLGMWKGKRAMYIGEVAGVRYIFTTANIGVSTPVWSHTTHANALSVRPLIHSLSGKQWIAACGTDGLLYSTDGGVSWISIAVPGYSNFAQLFG